MATRGTLRELVALYGNLGVIVGTLWRILATLFEFKIIEGQGCPEMFTSKFEAAAVR